MVSPGFAAGVRGHEGPSPPPVCENAGNMVITDHCDNVPSVTTWAASRPGLNQRTVSTWSCCPDELSYGSQPDFLHGQKNSSNWVITTIKHKKAMQNDTKLDRRVPEVGIGTIQGNVARRSFAVKTCLHLLHRLF